MAEFEFQRKTVYYESYGSGEPILLLNGIMMSTKSWVPFIESFSQNNRLILVDFFDQGQSADMTEAYDHSVQRTLTGALLDHLGLEKVNLCGISYGAEVGLGFAVEHPERVRRLVLFNGAARTAPQLADIGHSWNETARLEGGLAYYLVTIPVIYSDTYYERKSAWMDKRKKALVPYFADPQVKERLIRLTNSSENFNVIDKLSALDMPVLVISSEKDNLIPLGEQETMVQNIKHVHHVLLPDCGHASMYEQPLLFSTLTLGFINAPRTDFPI